MSLLSNLIKPFIKEHVQKNIGSAVQRELDRQLPSLIEKTMREKFAADPTRQLSPIGFKWALVLFFEEAWPDMDRKSAVSCARDCLEVPVGMSGYDWSALSARELVLDYVQTYGEAA